MQSTAVQGASAQATSNVNEVAPLKEVWNPAYGDNSIGFLVTNL